MLSVPTSSRFSYQPGAAKWATNYRKGDVQCVQKVKSGPASHNVLAEVFTR
jgi:hypothetical protein